MLELLVYADEAIGDCTFSGRDQSDIMAFLTSSWSDDGRGFFELSDDEAEDCARKRARVSMPVTEVASVQDLYLVVQDHGVPGDFAPINALHREVLEEAYTAWQCTNGLNSQAPAGPPPWKTAKKSDALKTAAHLFARELFARLTGLVFGLFTSDPDLKQQYVLAGATVVDVGSLGYFCFLQLRLPKTLLRSFRGSDRLSNRLSESVYYQLLTQPGNQTAAFSVETLITLVGSVMRGIQDEHGNRLCDVPPDGEEHPSAMFSGTVKLDWAFLTPLIFGSGAGDGRNPRLLPGLAGEAEFPTTGSTLSNTWIVCPDAPRTAGETVLFVTESECDGAYRAFVDRPRFLRYGDDDPRVDPGSLDFVAGNSCITGEVSISRIEEFIEMGETFLDLVRDTSARRSSIFAALRKYLYEFGKLNPAVLCTLLQQYGTSSGTEEDGLVVGVQPTWSAVNTLTDERILAVWHVFVQIGLIMAQSQDHFAQLLVFAGVPGSGKTEFVDAALSKLFKRLDLPNGAIANDRFSLQPMLVPAEKQLLGHDRIDETMLSQATAESHNIYGYGRGYYGFQYAFCLDAKEGPPTIPASFRNTLLGERIVANITAEIKGSYATNIPFSPIGAVMTRNGPHPKAMKYATAFSQFAASSLLSATEMENDADPVGANKRRLAPGVFFMQKVVGPAGPLLSDPHVSVDPRRGSISENMSKGNAGLALIAALAVATRTKTVEMLDFSDTSYYNFLLDKWAKLNSRTVAMDLDKFVVGSDEAFNGNPPSRRCQDGKLRKFKLVLPTSAFVGSESRITDKKYSLRDVENSLFPCQKTQRVKHCQHCGLTLQDQGGRFYREMASSELNAVRCTSDAHQMSVGTVYANWCIREACRFTQSL